MNADEIVKTLQAQFDKMRGAYEVMSALAEVRKEEIESLQAQLAASQRRAQDARNELCLKYGRYREAHNGACDGRRWKEVPNE
ncbi:MAG TPA: hypothetical protein PKL77_08550 [Candidatus Omnitrophota bacterium]|nr:hypothetical protein [Candidatus Omnitrophota bacterium]